MKKNSFLTEIYDLIETILTAFFVVSLILSYCVRMSDVDGPSMENTFHSEEKVIVLPWERDLSTGDVIVANTEYAYLLDDDNGIIKKEGLGKTVIKRVIATEGQTLDIDFNTGNVTVDGVLLNEPYITGLTHNDEGGFTGQYPLTVPEGYVFVMGDNRSVSMDSRSPAIGLVSENRIIGKVVFRFFPFDKIGKIG